MTVAQYQDADWLELYRTHLSTSYAEFLERFDLASTAVDAHGAVIRDSRGRSYIDLVAGYGLFNFFRRGGRRSSPRRAGFMGIRLARSRRRESLSSRGHSRRSSRTCGTSRSVMNTPWPTPCRIEPPP